jgi:hypothetical protein
VVEVLTHSLAETDREVQAAIGHPPPPGHPPKPVPTTHRPTPRRPHHPQTIQTFGAPFTSKGQQSLQALTHLPYTDHLTRSCGSCSSPAAASQRPAPVTRPSYLPRDAASNEASTTANGARPVQPSHLCPGREWDLGLVPELRTRPSPATQSGPGQVSNSNLELRPRHQPNLPLTCPLTTCDLTSQRTSAAASATSSRVDRTGRCHAALPRSDPPGRVLNPGQMLSDPS